MHINIGSSQPSANHNIVQIVDVCEDSQKAAKLVRLLDEILGEDSGGDKIIIFADTKRKVDEMTRTMRTKGSVAGKFRKGASCSLTKSPTYVVCR